MALNLGLFSQESIEGFIEKHPGVLLHVSEIQTSVRTQNCLTSEEVHYVGDLIQMTEQELLRFPNFGRKCQKEVIETLHNLNFHLGTHLPNWPPGNIELLRKKYSRKITKAKEKLYTLTHHITAASLEEELFNIANQNGERNAQIFVQRMGWDGHGGKTLDAVGKKYGMTRERVRQICSKIEKAIRLTRPPAIFVKRAIACANQSIPNAATLIEKIFVERNISNNPFRIEGLITAARLLGYNVIFGVEKIGRKRIRLAIHHDLIGAAKFIRQAARKHVEHWGAGTVADVISRVNTEHQVSVPDSLAILALESIEDFSWLDRATGWFWFANSSRNRTLNLIRKIVSVADCLTLNDLRAGIMRTHRMNGYSPPKRVLRSLCEQSGLYTISNNYVLAEPPLNWEDVLEGTNEYDLVLALKAYGPISTRSDLESLCTKSGMNRSSFYIYIGYSPILQRYARGVYGLRGATVSASEIEQLRKRVESDAKDRAISLNAKKVLLDYGRTTEGSIWTVYRISASTIFSGVITTPGPLKEYLHDEYFLYSADGAHMGSIKSNLGRTWGLGPFFRRRGAEEKDYLLLTFDLASKKAIAELGSEDLLDRATSKDK